ncbi:MAG: cytochrome c biogenesis protein CcdA [Actinomycetota bacterium]
MFAISTDSLSQWYAPAIALVAGVVSFASPCVLPLVPGYLSFVTGESLVHAQREGERAAGTRRLLPIWLFVAGFSVVFTLYGAFASTFVKVFKGTIGLRISGAVVIVLGLVMIAYALKRGPIWVFAERRPLLGKVRPGVAGAFPLGMAFAAGWTPCLGTILGGIIAIAGAQSATRGAFLLFVYSLGIGLPFVLLGIGVQWLTGTLGWIKRRYTVITTVSGAFLVLVGVLIATGQFTRIVAPLLRFAPGL